MIKQHLMNSHDTFQSISHHTLILSNIDKPFPTLYLCLGVTSPMGICAGWRKALSAIIQSISESLELKVILRARVHPDIKIAESRIIHDDNPSLTKQGTSWPIMPV